MLTLLLALAATAQAPATLDGKWTVDLSSEPGKPYTQPMELTLAADGTVSAPGFFSSSMRIRLAPHRGWVRRVSATRTATSSLA